MSHLETSVAIAREAGELLREYYRRRVQFELKGEFDLVTEADRASERLITARLRKEFPDHSIVAEEGHSHEGASEYRWYVDPLDGTTNFAHGFPVFNVTMALERAGELVAGVVYDPTREELFTAERGAGAFLNDERIFVSNAASLEVSLVATGFPSRRRHRDVNIHFYYQLGMMSHGVRRAGAAALDFAYVACGRLDAFWEFALNPWDMAAGILLVREAGGICSDMKGAAPDLRGPHVLADNGRIHEELAGIFDGIFRGEYRYPMPAVQG